MYFVRYNPVKEKLRLRTLSDREALPYLAVFIGLTALVGAFPMTDGFNQWDLASGVLSVIVAVSGVLYSYKCNGGREGYDLIHKYVVIGWIVAIRCTLLVIPLFAITLIAGEILGLISEDSGLFDFSAVFITEVVIYQRIGRHIRDTANP